MAASLILFCRFGAEDTMLDWWVC